MGVEPASSCLSLVPPLLDSLPRDLQSLSGLPRCPCCPCCFSRAWHGESSHVDVCDRCGHSSLLLLVKLFEVLVGRQAGHGFPHGGPPAPCFSVQMMLLGRWRRPTGDGSDLSRADLVWMAAGQLDHHIHWGHKVEVLPFLDSHHRFLS